MAALRSIDLRVADRLKDREFRRQWFRAMLEDNVPEQFRDLREARDMTQSELADAADMKQSAISRFEGQRVANWNFETLLKLADALDAQLEISITRAEDVIARYAREEASGSSGPNSVLEASASVGQGGIFNRAGFLNSKVSHLAKDNGIIVDDAHQKPVALSKAPLSGGLNLAPLHSPE